MKEILERIERKLDMLLDDRKLELAKAAVPKEYVEVSKDWFNDLCRTLLSHPKMTDAKFRESLSDLPKALERYGRLTIGQWKYFGVIHEKVLGTWPRTPPPIEAPPTKNYPITDLDRIPF